MLREGLQLKTTTLLFFFLWLAESFKNILTVLSDRIVGAFNRSGATRAVVLDISQGI